MIGHVRAPKPGIPRLRRLNSVCPQLTLSPKGELVMRRTKFRITVGGSSRFLSSLQKDKYTKMFDELGIPYQLEQIVKF